MSAASFLSVRPHCFIVCTIPLPHVSPFAAPCVVELCPKQFVSRPRKQPSPLTPIFPPTPFCCRSLAVTSLVRSPRSPFLKEKVAKCKCIVIVALLSYLKALFSLKIPCVLSHQGGVPDPRVPEMSMLMAGRSPKSSSSFLWSARRWAVVKEAFNKHLAAGCTDSILVSSLSAVLAELGRAADA